MSAKERNLLIVLLGVLLLIACYFLVYKPKSEENSTLYAENQSLSARLDELKAMIEQESFYNSEISRIDAEVKLELTEFPSRLQVENGIMDVVDMENFNNTTVPTLTVGTPAYVSVGESADASAENVEGSADTGVASAAAAQYSLYDVTTNIVFSASYTDTKSLINMIVDDDDKRCMRSFSATFDSTTGQLSGSISFDSYYIDGQDDKAYVPADIPSISHGIDNIFGTIEYSEPNDGLTENAGETEGAATETVPVDTTAGGTETAPADSTTGEATDGTTEDAATGNAA
jgi:hypothetical protein